MRPQPTPLRRGISAPALLALVVAAPLLGFVIAKQPALLVSVFVLGFLLLAIEAPVAAIGLFLFAHIATPTYFRVPTPGGFYDPPLSTTMLLALVGVGLLAFLARRPLPAPLGPDGRRLAGGLFVFAAIAAFSLIDPRTGGEGIAMWVKVFVLPTMLLLAVLCSCRNAGDVRRLTRFAIAGGIAASLYAVFEFALGRNPLLDAFATATDVEYHTSDVLGDIAYRCFSVYGNPLEFALVMGMIFPFAAVRVATAQRTPEKLAYAAICGILALGIALTFSRGPLLALVVGSVMLGLTYRQFRPWLALAVLGTGVVLIFAWPFIGAGIEDRINDVDNVTLRFKLWETAVAIFAEKPVMGVGIGNFPQYYLEAARENHIGPFHEFGPARVEDIRVAENAYLQLAAETGLVGLAAGAAFALLMLGLCLRLAGHARDPLTRELATAIAVSAAIYASNALFVTAYAFYFATLLFLGLLIGCLLVLDRAESRGAEADRQ